MKKILIECMYSDGEILKLELEKEYDLPGVYLSIIGCEISGLLRRFKVAFEFLLYGEYRNYGLFIDQNGAKRIISFLKENLLEE